MTTYISRFGVLLVACVCLFCLAINPTFAEHGDSEEAESHATSIEVTNVHTDDEINVTPTYTPTIDVTKIQNMQALLKALQQLVVLLQELQDLEHEVISHSHDDATEHNAKDHA